MSWPSLRVRVLKRQSEKHRNEKDPPEQKQKSFVIFRLEQKILQLEKRVASLEDQLEESNIENKKLRAMSSPSTPRSIPSSNSPPQFNLSL